MDINQTVRKLRSHLSREQLTDLLCRSYDSRDGSFDLLMRLLAGSDNPQERKIGINCAYLSALRSFMEAVSVYRKTEGREDYALQSAATDLQNAAADVLPSLRSSTRHALIRLIAQRPELGERMEGVCRGLCISREDYLDLARDFESLGVEPWPTKADAIYREFPEEDASSI